MKTSKAVKRVSGVFLGMLFVCSEKRTKEITRAKSVRMRIRFLVFRLQGLLQDATNCLAAMQSLAGHRASNICYSSRFEPPSSRVKQTASKLCSFGKYGPTHKNG